MSARPIFRLLLAFFRILPESLALFLGRLLGYFWYYIVPIRRTVVQEQLRRALGTERPPDELRHIARGVFVNLTMNLVEFLRLNPEQPERILQKVSRQAMERFEAAAAKGKGVLVLTAHFGNWDLLCCSQSLAGHPITILSKQIKPDWLNEYWMSTRSRCGVRILPTRHVRTELLQRLTDDQVIGFVIDQHMPEKRGIASEFFGRPASTTPGLAELSLDSGAPVVPIFIERLENGRHRMWVEEAIEPILDAERSECVQRLTDRYNQVLEEVVRQRPDHWLWLHRRWKIAQKSEPQTKKRG